MGAELWLGCEQLEGEVPLLSYRPWAWSPATDTAWVSIWRFHLGCHMAPVVASSAPSMSCRPLTQCTCATPGPSDSSPGHCCPLAHSPPPGLLRGSRGLPGSTQTPGQALLGSSVPSPPSPRGVGVVPQPQASLPLAALSPGSLASSLTHPVSHLRSLPPMWMPVWHSALASVPRPPDMTVTPGALSCPHRVLPSSPHSERPTARSWPGRRSRRCTGDPITPAPGAPRPLAPLLSLSFQRENPVLPEPPRLGGLTWPSPSRAHLPGWAWLPAGARAQVWPRSGATGAWFLPAQPPPAGGRPWPQASLERPPALPAQPQPAQASAGQKPKRKCLFMPAMPKAKQFVVCDPNFLPFFFGT